MKNESYPLNEMKDSLKKLEAEAGRLKALAKGFPAVVKNIDPIMTFIDILNFHLIDIRS
jgi:hypothetical protein